VGSCAQIGCNVHLSGGVGIGGVLEPLQANLTIIEDNCFMARVRGRLKASPCRRELRCWGWACSSARARRSTISDRGRELWPRARGSVVVAGSLPSGTGDCHLYCAVIAKRVDAKTRSKTSINELLRA
jgi:2,3,4,5-tetrahydropyridine-2-carboxylate N-succinyltransferase